jgi:hypothetical protein
MQFWPLNDANSANDMRDEFFLNFYAKCWLNVKRKENILLCGAKLGYDSCPYLISLDRISANDLGVRTLAVKGN